MAKTATADVATVSEIRGEWDCFFVWCDIDGHGKSWRLAIVRQDEFADEDDAEELYFPIEDFGDAVENYNDTPAVAIDYPRNL